MLKSFTLVLGVSLKPHRYSHLAVQRLITSKHPVIGVGLKSGTIEEVPILTFKEAFAKSEQPKNTEDGFPDIDTITLYIGPRHQPEYYDLMLNIKPRRVIFNPGTENMELIGLLQKAGIYAEVACTLVLLSTNQY